MDPLSVTAGVVGLLDSVSRLALTISQLRDDYKLADEDLNIARNHALLLEKEINQLEATKWSNYSPPRKSAKDTTSLSMDESSFGQAMSTARDLLADIEASFPLRSEPHTWRSKLRWAMKDKKTFTQLKERLKSAESTLQSIVSLEQLRVSHMIHGMVRQQQSIMGKIERGEILGQNVINMAVVNQSGPESAPSVIKAQLTEITPTTKQQPAYDITRPNKLVPRVARFEQAGFSVELVTLPKDKDTSYHAVMHVALFGRLFSVQLQVSFPGLSFDRSFRVRNIIPSDSAMAMACRTGDFDTARKLLTDGLAHGSDVAASGSPMLDYAIESGSARLVRLLLDHGAEADFAYGEHNMTALQSSFLRGRIDMARMLISNGADIEHVDSDGYSVLSYLWVGDGQVQQSVDFMRLCQAQEFSEVNSCDSRGWMPLHRAAAVGTPEDIDVFLQLGASLTLRAEWYGWTPLFFAASHDNVATFERIVSHSGPDVYDSLDGDGWNLLHCCIYFGAPRVMKMVLQSGIDVNQKTLPAPLPEDPELSYRELTAYDIAIYIGPNRYQMFLDALIESGRVCDLEDSADVFWDAYTSEETPGAKPIYGAEDVDDRWTLLHWASYNGSPKIKRLLLMKGVDPEHLEAVTLEDNPTVLPTSPFDAR